MFVNGKVKYFARALELLCVSNINRLNLFQEFSLVYTDISKFSVIGSLSDQVL